MKLRTKITLFLSILVFSVSAQFAPTKNLKELTLEDAILKRFSDFYPENISGLRWYGDQLVKYGDEKKLILSLPLDGKRTKTVLSLEQLNNSLGKSWTALPRFSFGDDQMIHFRKDGAYFAFDVQKKKGSQLFEVPKGIENASFSAEAKSLAYTMDNNLYISNASYTQQAITKHTDKNIVAGQAIARYEMGITKGTFWSPTGKHLAFYQKDESQVTNYPLVDMSTTPATVSNTKYPMAGQSSEYAQIGVFDLINNQLIYLDTDGNERDQYLTNLTWGPKGKYIYVAVVNRDQDHVWLNKYNAKTGKLVKTLFEETDERYVEPENDLYFIPGNDKEFLWYSERDGYNHLYRYNTKGKLINQVTKGNWAVLDILGLNKESGDLIIVGTDVTGLNKMAYRTPLENEKTKTIREDKGIHSYQMNASGTMLIDNYTDLNTPRKVDVINMKGKVEKALLSAKNPLQNHHVGNIELVNFKANDGTPLHGRIIKPHDFDPSKKYPVFVYLYGGPHAQMVTNRWLGGAPLWMLHAAERGYIVFTMDNRGSANRGNEFESIIHRQLGTKEMEDQLSGVEFLKTLPYADTDNMAVHGWSFGGFMATTLMLRSPGTFDVGIAGGPVTDWKFYEVMYGERYMDSPQSNPEGYETADLKQYVNNLEGDLLLIHGSVDPTVVPQHSLDLMKAFIDNGVQMDFFTYPMHPHNVRGKDRVHLMRKVLDYTDNKLKLKVINKK